MKRAALAFAVWSALLLFGAERVSAQDPALLIPRIDAFPPQQLGGGPVTFSVTNEAFVFGFLHRYQVTTTITGSKMKVTVTLVGGSPRSIIGSIPANACGLDPRKIVLDLENATAEHQLVDLGKMQDTAWWGLAGTRLIQPPPPRELPNAVFKSQFTLRLPKRESAGVVWMQFFHGGSLEPSGVRIFDLPNAKDGSIKVTFLGNWTADRVQGGVYDSHQTSFQCL